MKFGASLLTLLLSAAAIFADDNIVIVFDTSGSMSSHMRTANATRIAVAQNALINVLSKVPESTKVGVLTFEGWIYDLKKVDRIKLEAAINNTRPGGGTPLYEYIATAGNRLLEERAKMGNVGYYKMIVVTDGVADSDRMNKDSTFLDGSFKPGVLKDIIGRGITVDAIGLEMSGDHPLKNQINGRYMRGDDPNSIEKSLKTAVAEIGFSGKDAMTTEAFSVVSNLPENFVKSSILGLTEFRNHPLGTKPPIMVVGDGGVITKVPAPDLPKASLPPSSLFNWFIAIVCGAFLFVVIFIWVKVSSR